MILLVVGSATTGTVGAQAPGCLPTSARTVGPHDFPGLRIKRLAPVDTDALQFVLHQNPGRNLDPDAAQPEANALNREGFVSGISQRFKGKKPETRGDMGLSTTLQLGSRRQARAHFHRDLAKLLQELPWRRFKVPAIPGSQGMRAKYDSHGVHGASNVVFTDGVYWYLVGRYVKRGKRGGTGAKQATKAATQLYNRVHGAAVCA